MHSHLCLDCIKDTFTVSATIINRLKWTASIYLCYREHQVVRLSSRWTVTSLLSLPHSPNTRSSCWSRARNDTLRWSSAQEKTWTLSLPTVWVVWMPWMLWVDCCLRRSRPQPQFIHLQDYQYLHQLCCLLRKFRTDLLSHQVINCRLSSFLCDPFILLILQISRSAHCFRKQNVVKSNAHIGCIS